MSTSRTSELSVEQKMIDPVAVQDNQAESTPISQFTYQLPNAHIIEAVFKLYILAKNEKAKTAYGAVVEFGMTVLSAVIETPRTFNLRKLEELSEAAQDLNNLKAWLNFTYVLGSTAKAMQDKKQNKGTLGLACRMVFFMLGYIWNHLQQQVAQHPYLQVQLDNEIEQLRSQIPLKKSDIKKLLTKLAITESASAKRLINEELKEAREELDELWLRLTYLGDKKGREFAIQAKLLSHLKITLLDTAYPECLHKNFYSTFYKQRLQKLTTNDLERFIETHTKDPKKITVTQTVSEATTPTIRNSTSSSTHQISQGLSVESEGAQASSHKSNQQPITNAPSVSETAEGRNIQEHSNQQPESITAPAQASHPSGKNAGKVVKEAGKLSNNISAMLNRGVKGNPDKNPKSDQTSSVTARCK